MVDSSPWGCEELDTTEQPALNVNFTNMWNEHNCTVVLIFFGSSLLWDRNEPDNHDGLITHQEPDILESEVKWALGRNVKNKATGGDGIPVELIQILKDDAIKVLHSVCQ